MSVNEINKDVNILTDQSSDFGLSELGRIGEQLTRLPHSQQDQRRRYSDAIALMAKLGGEDAYQKRKQLIAIAQAEYEKQLKRGAEDSAREYLKSIKKDERRVRAYEAAQSRIASLGPRIATYDLAADERFSARAVNSFERQLSDTRIGVFASKLKEDPTAIASGLSLAAQHSYGELVAMRQTTMSEIGARRKAVLEASRQLVSGGAIDPERESSIRENIQQIQQLSQELASSVIALEQKKLAGEDPQSRFRDRERMRQKAQGILDFNQLESDIKARKGPYGGLTGKEFKKLEEEAASNLIKALDDLSNSAGEAADVVAKFEDAATEASKKLQEIQDAKAAGAGGGGRWESVQKWSSAVAQTAALAGHTIQQIGVNLPMREMANISGFVGLENMKHDSWRRAMHGSMVDRLTLGAWDGAYSFADDRAFWTGTRVGLDVVGGGAAAIGGGAQTIAALISANPGDNITRGLLATAEGAAMTAIAEEDARRGVSTGEARIAGIMGFINKMQNLTHIQAYQLQNYRDHSIDLLDASINMGASRGNSFLATTTNEDFMHRMRAFGLGSKRLHALSSWGARNLGSLFDENQTLQAKRFENLGFGTAEDQMSRMVSLSAGGTHDPGQSLEKMLERAFAVGLDSSTAINLIAENTGALSEKEAMRGFTDLGGQISKHILTAVDPNNPNETLAVKRAVSVFQQSEQDRNNRGVNWHGMINISRIMQGFGIEFEEASALQGMSLAQLRELRGKDPNAVKKAFWERGIDLSSFGDKSIDDILNQAINYKMLSMGEAGPGLALNIGKSMKIVRDWLNEDLATNARIFAEGNIDQMPDEVIYHTRKINQSSQFRDRAPDDIRREMLAALGMDIDQYVKPLDPGTMQSIAGTNLGDAIRERDRGSMTELDAAIFGLKEIFEAQHNNGMQLLALSGDIVERALGANPEKQWANAAEKIAKAGGDFSESSTKLNLAAHALTAAANRLLAASGSPPINRSPRVPLGPTSSTTAITSTTPAGLGYRPE